MKYLAFILLSLSILTFANPTDYPDCGGTENTLPLIDIQPELVATVTNGRKYIIQSDNVTHLYIIALQGNWSEAGFAYGQLMKEELADGIPGMYNYMVEQVEVLLEKLKNYIPFYTKWIPNLLSLDKKEILNSLLDLTEEFTAPYTPKRYTEELKGIAEGSGVDLKMLTKLNLIAELEKAQCTMVGAWGSATPDGALSQLRALDWDFQAYIIKYPLAIVYFPEDENANPFVNLAFAGMVGAFSGFSEKVALSEKVWLPVNYDAKTFFGEPFMYTLRDMLEFGNDLESSMGVLMDSARTCKVHVGVGSKADNSFEGVEMGYNEFYIFNDKNYTNYTTAHPQMDGIMFWDKHPQPSTNQCVGSILLQNHGNIGPEFLFRTVAALHETGDAQVVVYDFNTSTVYLSYSDPIAQITAYTRPFMKLNMTQLLSYEEMMLGGVDKIEN